MLLARVSEADPAAPRLVEPELRSRVVGYLGTAPVATLGYRTDGVWVWLQSMVDQVRSRGAGPQRDQLDHMIARDLIPPVELPRHTLDEAGRVADGRPSAAGPRAAEAYFASYLGRDLPPNHLVRRARAADGTTHHARFGPSGWADTDVMRLGVGVPGTVFEELAKPEAARLMDRLCAGWHERLRREALESEPAAAELALARVFDGENSSGMAWFSPARLRIVEPARRARLAAYLSGGRLVLRATGRAIDPLDPRRGAVVPLNFRTDGVWVWQEANAYYVRTRGLAPELALLCHIEERGCRPPEAVPDETAAAAAVVARGPVPSRPRIQPPTYYANDRSGRSGVLVRAPGGDTSRAEALEHDLRWRWSDVLCRDPGWAGYGLFEVPAEEAVRIIDDRLARRLVE